FLHAETDAVGELLALGGQRPLVRGAKARSETAMGDQADALQTPQQLRNLALVRHAGALPHQTIGWTDALLAELGDRAQDTHRAISDAHARVFERVRQRPRLATARYWRECRQGTRQLTPRRRRA